MSSADLHELAFRQLSDYDRHEPGTAFGTAIELSLAEAMQVQSMVAGLREARGERVIGYKVGCTSPVIRKRLGIPHPVFGRLFETECWPSGTTLPSSRFAGLAIEGELAVKLACDLPVTDAQSVEISGAIESVFPVIELHNAVFRSDQPALELVANNALQAGFVFPEIHATGFDSGASKLRIEMGGAEIAAVDGPVLTETVASSLNWLAQELRAWGEVLLAGQTVLCGSVADLFPVKVPTHIRVLTDRFGEVECFVEDANSHA